MFLNKLATRSEEGRNDAGGAEHEARLRSNSCGDWRRHAGIYGIARFVLVCVRSQGVTPRTLTIAPSERMSAAAEQPVDFADERRPHVSRVRLASSYSDNSDFIQSSLASRCETVPDDISSTSFKELLMSTN